MLICSHLVTIKLHQQTIQSVSIRLSAMHTPSIERCERRHTKCIKQNNVDTFNARIHALIAYMYAYIHPFWSSSCIQTFS